MIFKHEFIITKEELKHIHLETVKIRRQDQCEYELGMKIAEVFGWGKVDIVEHSNVEDDRFRLEIVAFNMKDWEVFRQRLNYFLSSREMDTLLHDLEYGPAQAPTK